MTFDPAGKTELFAAFVKAQAKFEVPKRTKTARVQTRSGSSYEYKYSTLEDLIAATRPALAENGLAVFNNVTMPGQNVVAVTAVIVHTSGQTHETDPIIFQVDGSPQATGGAITYGRRYSQSALLGVAAEDDNDAGNSEPRTQGSKPANARNSASTAKTESAPEPEPAAGTENEPITDAQFDRLVRVMKEHGVKRAQMKAWLASIDIPEAKQIKRGQYNNIILAVQSGKLEPVAKAGK